MQATPTLPEIVAHADWCTHSRKRWVAVARRAHGGYIVESLGWILGQSGAQRSETALAGAANATS